MILGLLRSTAHYFCSLGACVSTSTWVCLFANLVLPTVCSNGPPLTPCHNNSGILKDMLALEVGDCDRIAHSASYILSLVAKCTVVSPMQHTSQWRVTLLRRSDFGLSTYGQMYLPWGDWWEHSFSFIPSINLFITCHRCSLAFMFFRA